MNILHITVNELVTLQKKNPAGFTLLDIREDFEREICVLPHDLHISMSQIQHRYQELDIKKKIIVYCRSGQRSLQVTGFLIQQGYDAHNLEGGILAWNQNIDPLFPIY